MVWRASPGEQIHGLSSRIFRAAPPRPGPADARTRRAGALRAARPRHGIGRALRSAVLSGRDPRAGEEAPRAQRLGVRAADDAAARQLARLRDLQTAVRAFAAVLLDVDEAEAGAGKLLHEVLPSAGAIAGCGCDRLPVGGNPPLARRDPTGSVRRARS